MKLEALLALLPKGTWTSDGNVLIDPKGERVGVITSGQGPATERLLTESIAVALTELPTLLSQLTAQTQRVSDAVKAAKHCADRVRQSYNQALTDTLDAVYTQETITLSARNALETLTHDIERLRKDDTPPPSQHP